ncbi:MAG: bifunctional riboflavin kinase/FAD synthetase [Gammaproteobacteria bacterium]|nr:bifunctional riboflavin kinase/FAD synthetase [Gammaproteobacteria bacterium]
MELIRGLHNVRPSHAGCVATIGNFDGVHLGHQAVLGQLAEKATALNLPSLVITFEPYPQEFFRPDQAPPRLTRLREKLLALRRYAVDRVLCLRFDAALASMEAERFIDEILVGRLGVRYLVVGDDFRFGSRRRGDFAMLQAAGRRHGFQVVGMLPFDIDGARVSSTRIREALRVGGLALAGKLLGRSYRMAGRIVHGDKRGRTLGFPTANLYLHRQVSPLQGVYAVAMFGLDQEPVPGVANIGTRPTVGGQRSLLEVHLLDFSGDIYRRQVQVEFLTKLRDELRFESLAALTAQIAQDVQQAREYFGQQQTLVMATSA